MKIFFGLTAIILIFVTSITIQAELKDISKLFRFPFQDSTKINYCRSQPLTIDNDIAIIYSANYSPEDTIFITRSSDEGVTWSTPNFVAAFKRSAEEKIFISGTVTKAGRILVTYSIGELIINNKTKIVHSDDGGINWTLPENIIGSAFIPHPKISELQDGKLWIVGRLNYIFYSVDDGVTWSAKNIGFYLMVNSSADLISLDSLNFILAYDKYDSNEDSYKCYFRRSTDSGDSWSEETLETETGRSEKNPILVKKSSHEFWLITQVREATNFTTGYNIYEQNIVYRSKTTSIILTNYIGFDGEQNFCLYNGKPLITFLSDRWYGKNQIWVGQIGVSEDIDPPPGLLNFDHSNIIINDPIKLRAFVGSKIGIQKTELISELNDSLSGPIQMFDDGNHNDELPNDNIWGIEIGPFNYYDVLKTSIKVTDNNSQSVIFPGSTLVFPALPVKNKWLSVGSLHNWYSSRGSEVEEGYEAFQQYGLRWPGIYPYQDMQASKGFWIGATDFKDENGRIFPHKVVQVGPKDMGEFEFFEKEFSLVSKFPQPEVIVNNQPSHNYPNQIDEVDPNLPCDRMIYNTANTQLGITVERKIYQFSQEYHDNYIINEYTFTNTGNVDFDDNIELPNNTIKGLYFYYLYRWAINRQTRFVIGNPTGWGINTMIDARGDSVVNDPLDEQIRCQFAWHGFTNQKVVDYNNIGGPIWEVNSISNPYVDSGDTIGRLGAPQFVGVITLHADNSADDKADNLNQPATTSWENSDDPLTFMNDPYNDEGMTAEYEWISKGHKSPRHAYAVEPSGNFAEQTVDPSLGTSGGFSAANGYGPYTLLHGESVKIVWAEAADGIDRETAINVGKQFKHGQISAKQKNEIVLTGKDSLIKTFKKAVANYNNGDGFTISQPPYPPNKFVVSPAEDKVHLSWEHSGEGPLVKSFEIYRATGSYDSSYTLVHTTMATDTSFIDSTIERNKYYFYYILSAGDPNDNNGNAMSLPGALRSSRYYTQTYNPVTSTLTSIIDGNLVLDEFKLYQNYPNPFNPSTLISYQIPKSGYVTLKVYDVLGREIKTLVKELKAAGAHKVIFDASNLASGMYIYKIQVDNFSSIKKMMLLK